MPYFGLTDQLIILFCFVVIMIGNQLSPNVLLFLCNAIGQLCQGGLGYSSCTVTLSQTRGISTGFVQEACKYIYFLLE